MSTPEVVVRQIGNAIVHVEVSCGPSGHAATRLIVDAPTGITLRMLRDIPFAAIVADVRGRITVDLPPAGALPVTSGHTRLSDDLLRQVALVFIEETGPGKDGRAMQRTAARFGRSEDTVRQWVAKARSRGWLAPGYKGRSGGEPGPRWSGWQPCETCDGSPPDGFACRACGAEGGTL